MTTPAKRTLCRHRPCRKKFTRRTPGQAFCTPSCRKRAADAVRPPKTGADLRKQGSEGVHLGTLPTEFPAGSDLRKREETPKERLAREEGRRREGRRALRRATGTESCRNCGRTVVDPESGVLFLRTPDGRTVEIGWMSCGRIWLCPVCSASIRSLRTAELRDAALRWLALGGRLVVVVLTARHSRADRAQELADALWGTPMEDAQGNPVTDASGKARRTPGAYQRLLTAKEFTGRRASARSRHGDTSGIRHRIGYAGMVRASEVTRSEDNGWNLHMNLLAFVGATVNGTPATGEVTGFFEPSADALEEYETWLRHYWQDTVRSINPKWTPTTECERRNCKCGGKGHGVSFSVVASPDAKALVEYLTKVQDGRPDTVEGDLEAARSAVSEVTRGDWKASKIRRSMTPFQMLYRLYDLEISGLHPDDAEGYGTVAQCRAWWLEYEQAMAGRRAIEWTRGLRRHTETAGDGSTAEDIAAAQEAANGGGLDAARGVHISEDAARRVVKAEADDAVRECVAADALDSVADVVESAGGRRDHVQVVAGQEAAEQIKAFRARLGEKSRQAAKERRFEAEEVERLRESGTHTVDLAPCAACDGSGHRAEFAHNGGKCFPCNGSGRVRVATDDEHDQEDDADKAAEPENAVQGLARLIKSRKWEEK